MYGVRLYGEHANVHQSHSQNDSGDLRGVAGGDGELGCLCGKAGTIHLCDGSACSVYVCKDLKGDGTTSRTPEFVNQATSFSRS